MWGSMLEYKNQGLKIWCISELNVSHWYDAPIISCGRGDPRPQGGKCSVYNKGSERNSPLCMNQTTPIQSEITFKMKLDCSGCKNGASGCHFNLNSESSLRITATQWLSGLPLLIFTIKDGVNCDLLFSSILPISRLYYYLACFTNKDIEMQRLNNLSWVTCWVSGKTESHHHTFDFKAQALNLLINQGCKSGEKTVWESCRWNAMPTKGKGL